ncbi:MAG: glycosyltransferase family 2 protein [Brevundimonas sp.]|uniref:glycosyltransferase family 2 protein n=1 Tax=Brevundimonas sp. TaxID=1871086 RepID=UPI00271F34ED|nr:glycosyltransferase family 2 protein [Brevundimonas sp.]MDO9589112.1 glycosyltransferase family 2 protein [Brevundimonas sp.]MDP3657058.1 glycosyltransferase family 2 protein [Brevundimonas sp.]MDZ4113089.1 glycosyltransferase family 2 protein [Brevundimonas sp.]
MTQIATIAALAGLLALFFWRRPDQAANDLVLALAAAFLTMAVWRTALILLSARPVRLPPEPAAWPRYTVLAALYDEAEVVGQLVERLSAIDYPPDRLQGLLVLEAHDPATLAAALATPRPEWLEIMVAPPGGPATKPRALNCALARATGALLTVYDAEDEPHPLQLREAAARFVADTDGRLACLQAPLRIRAGSRFLERQFAAEYASLFEAVLPGMARLGLPFPLGGTSNHFRVDVLRAVGGWDAWNVTEDADLGFRLWSHGWRLGVIARPTRETPPRSLDCWLPQRTRWLKGYLQTWGVHTRRPWRLGWRGAAALVMTVGAGLVSAAIHGLTLAWVAAAVLVSAMAGLPPETSLLALSVLVLGAASAWLSCAIGARRAGVPYGAADMLTAPAYWTLLSLAFAHAVWRLVRDPFGWDKTPHRPDAPAGTEHLADVETVSYDRLDATAPLRLSAGHAAAPEPVA